MTNRTNDPRASDFAAWRAAQTSEDGRAVVDALAERAADGADVLSIGDVLPIDDAAPEPCPEAFWVGYLACLTWCDVMVDGLDGMTTDHGLDFEPEDVPDDVLDVLRVDCDAFWAEFGERIDAADEAGAVSTGFDVREQAGHDFHLTRNRHGAGFWDGDWPEPLASALTDGAKCYGPASLMTWWDEDGRTDEDGDPIREWVVCNG